MHIITTTKEMNLGPGAGLLPEGEYLLDTKNCGRLMVMDDTIMAYAYHPGWLTNTDLLSFEKPRVLITGGGAFGDLLLLTPVIKKLQKMGLHVTVACFEQYAQVLNGTCDTIAYPTPCGKEFRFDGVLSLEGAWRDTEENRNMHLTDVFADLCNVELTEKSPVYSVLSEERQDAINRYPRTEKKRIGIQVNASTPNRSYLHSNRIVSLLLEKGYEVFMFGAPGEINLTETHPRITNCTQDKLTFRQSVAVLEQCDGFIGPDSALIHYAGTLGVPSIGLYGAFSWKGRTAYYPSVFSIQGAKDCTMAPCHHHGSPHAPFPKGGPCRKAGYCTALASIEPERIISKMESLIL